MVLEALSWLGCFLADSLCLESLFIKRRVHILVLGRRFSSLLDALSKMCGHIDYKMRNRNQESEDDPWNLNTRPNSSLVHHWCYISLSFPLEQGAAEEGSRKEHVG
ncbi:unnamed protein product [Natator depressus]